MTISSTRFRFTQRAIDQLPSHTNDSRSRFAEYSDTEATGLRLLVNHHGRRWFYFRVTFQGRKRVLKLGEYPALGLVEARRKAFALRADADRGIDPTQGRDEQRNMPTFAEFAMRDFAPFIQTKRSVKNDLSKLRLHLIPHFGDRRLDSIAVRDVQAYHARIRQSHSPATANRHLSVLSKLFSCAVQWNILQRSPCAGVTKFQENNIQQRFLTIDEIRRLYRAMEQAGPRSDYCVAALKCMLLTGNRRSEVLNARWEHIQNLEVWYLPFTKNGKAHYVPLNDETKALLSTLPRISGCPWIFPGRNPNRPLVEVRRCLNRLASMAGIPPLRVHDLRHSFVSLCLQGGGSLFQAKALLNHASTTTTQRYAHLTASDLRAASQLVSTAISTALQKE